MVRIGRGRVVLERLMVGDIVGLGAVGLRPGRTRAAEGGADVVGARAGRRGLAGLVALGSSGEV